MNTLQEIVATKQARKDGDALIQQLKALPRSRECSLAITKVQEAVMWLGMNLKRINEEDDPSNTKIEPTADGLKL